jgi:flagellar biosynthesis/type III secretory pathway M-ring protein FliF/YscJ
MSVLGIIVLVVVVAVIVIALFALAPRMRERSRIKARERELEQRRGQMVAEQREEANRRSARAEEAERRAEIAAKEAQRERAEARRHQEQAQLHEQGMADHELIEDHERERFAGTSAVRDDPAADGHQNRLDGGERERSSAFENGQRPAPAAEFKEARPARQAQQRPR